MQIRGTWPAGPDDDQARFLADLRALRDSAAIGHDELAARAHYPSNVLKEAESGPCLPGLPILAAYVRACDGDVPGWEERWRRLNPDVADDPDLPVRPAGASAAAVAGARAGVGVGPPDVYDPERIRAALRGDHARSERASRRADAPATPALPPSAPAMPPSAPALPPSAPAMPPSAPAMPPSAPAAFPIVPVMPSSAPAAFPSVPAAASSDQGPEQPAGAAPGTGSGWDPAAGSTIMAANGNHSAAHEGRGPFEAARTDEPDSAAPAKTAEASDFSWLRKSTSEARGADSSLAWLERTNAGPAGVTPAPAEPAGAGPPLQRQPSPEAADFWATPAARAELQPPATPLWRADDPAGTRASPTGPGGTAAPGSAGEPDTRRPDRFFPVRLLIVIVIAALIGSALVMLLK